MTFTIPALFDILTLSNTLKKKGDNTNILHSTETRRRQGFLLAALLLSEQELNNSAKGRESSSDKCVHLLIIKICIFTHKENIQRI